MASDANIEDNENINNISDEANIDKLEKTNEVQLLLHELKEFKKSNAELLQALIQLKNENEKLKQLLKRQDTENAGDMPRKVAKFSPCPVITNLSNDNSSYANNASENNVNVHFPVNTLTNMPANSFNTNKALGANTNRSNASTVAGQSDVLMDNASNININGNNSCNEVFNVPMSINTVVNATKANKNKIFQAVDTNLNNVRRTIKNANCKNFVIKQANARAPIKITVQSDTEVAYVRDALAKNNISFHEFKRNDERNKCYLIRGIVDATADCLPEIKDELVSAGIPEEATLSMFITGHMRANTNLIHDAILKLVVPPNFDEKVLKNIRYVNHVAVNFVTFKSHAVVQCKNCQRFGHTAGGCQHKHRCVKCGQNHFKDSCPRSFSKAVKLICCNCGGEHSANNVSACSYFKDNYPKKPVVDAASKQQPKNAAVSVHGCSNVPASTSASTSGHNRNFSQTYATITKGVNEVNDQSLGQLTEISKKIDAMFTLVMKHDAIIQGLIKHG